jgi:hypothetical protein
MKNSSSSRSIKLTASQLALVSFLADAAVESGAGEHVRGLKSLARAVKSRTR